MTVPQTSAPGPFPWHRYLAPRHWPTWLGLGLLRAWGALPYPLLLGVGRALGTLGWGLVPSRRRVARTNLRLVFPELPEREIRRLARQAFINAAIALGESALAWWGREARLARLDHFEGAEHLERALARGRGVLLLGGHYTTLEVSGRLLARHCERVFPTYKPAHSPLFEAVMARARRRVHAGLIPSRDMRALLRRLRENQVVWYAPDQDFGLAQSVMAPFMGVPAATLTLTARLAARSGAPVLPLYSERLPGARGYLVRIGPPLENFPSGDEAADAAAVNRAIEAQVRRTPDQYLWGHRRFKTRPRGEAEFYPPRRDSRLRRYSLALAAAALPLAALTAWQALRARSPGYLPTRLGRPRPARSGSTPPRWARSTRSSRWWRSCCGGTRGSTWCSPPPPPPGASGPAPCCRRRCARPGCRWTTTRPCAGSWTPCAPAACWWWRPRSGPTCFSTAAGAGCPW